MKKKRKGDSAEDGAAPKKGKAGSIGMAVTFSLIGTVLGPKLLGTGAPAAAAPESDTTTTTEVVPGEVIVIDKFTLNLSDGHLLQVGLALELAAPEEGAEAAAGGHGAAADEDTPDPTKGYAKAIDAAIGVLGDETMAALSAPGGREAAKAAITEALHEPYHGEVLGVYFHTFVMQ